MVIQNPTSIDSLVFEFIANQAIPYLEKRYLSDLYYNAIYIHKIFCNWSACEPLEFWLIVRPDGTNLLTDKHSFDIRRYNLINNYSAHQCFKIEIIRGANGWELRGETIR